MVATSAAHPKTYADFLKTPDDGQRYELIDGEIIVSPSPTILHQRAVKRLTHLLDDYVLDSGLGEVFLSPMDVRLEPEIVVQPDICFVRTGTTAELPENGRVEGVPDLMIEILSPSNPGHDLVRKRELYARFRIPEYWILSPLERTLTVLTLKDGRYVEHRSTKGVASSKVLPGFTLDIAAFYETVYP
jgi:Uma2 family endonuclease